MHVFYSYIFDVLTSQWELIIISISFWTKKTLDHNVNSFNQVIIVSDHCYYDAKTA